MKRLVIMRGLSGSGKSTLARSIKDSTREVRDGIIVEICSTDNFFIGDDGEYNFDPSKLGEAHAWNQLRVEGYMAPDDSGWDSTIIVDNTNTMMWEAKPYVDLARKHGYTVELLESDTPWAKDPKVCAEKTKHGVPLEVIEAQLARWENFDDLDVVDTVLE